MISRSADVRYDRTPTSTPTKVEVSTFDVVRGARSERDFGDAVSANDDVRKFFATFRASRSSRVLRGEVGEVGESLSDEAVGLSPSDEPFLSFASCSISDSDSEPGGGRDGRQQGLGRRRLSGVRPCLGRCLAA